MGHSLPSPHFQHHPRLSRGEGLCPRKEHLVTWEGSPGISSATFYRSSAQGHGSPSRGAPQSLMAETPCLELTNGTPQAACPPSSGARPWGVEACA